MQPRNEFRPCRRCRTMVAADLWTGDLIERDPKPDQPRIYKWHDCKGPIPKPAANGLRQPRFQRGSFIPLDETREDGAGGTK